MTKKSPYQEDQELQSLLDAKGVQQISQAAAPSEKVGPDFTYLPPKQPQPIPKPMDPKKTQKKKVRREVARYYRNFGAFLSEVEVCTRTEFIETRQGNEDVPHFPEFAALAGKEVLKDLFLRLPTEFQDLNEIHWFLESNWKDKFPELHIFLIACGVRSFILDHCKDVEERNSGVTHHQEAETGEADRRAAESEEDHGQARKRRGREPSANVDERREIVNRHIQSKSDWEKRQKREALVKDLKKKGIPTPRDKDGLEQFAAMSWDDILLGSRAQRDRAIKIMDRWRWVRKKPPTTTE